MSRFQAALFLFVIFQKTSVILAQYDETTVDLSEMQTKGVDSLLPPFMKICARNLPKQKRNECLKESIESLVPALKDGYKPLGIPAFDPFFVDTYTLEYGGEMLSTKLKLSNVYIHGAKNIKIKDVQSKINEKHLYVEIAIIFDKLTTEGGFKGHSKFLGTSVRSDGRCKIITEGVSYTLKLLGTLNRTKDEELMIITASELTDIHVRQMKIEGTGFLPDPDVNQLALEFINQHWRSFIGQMLPVTVNVWQTFYVAMANKIFERVPFRSLMPEDQ